MERDAVVGELDQVSEWLRARPLLPGRLREELLARIHRERARLLVSARPEPLPRPLPVAIPVAPAPAAEPPAPRPPLVPEWLRALAPVVAENLLYVLGAFLLVAGAGYFVSTAWTTMDGPVRLLVVQGGLGVLAALLLGFGRLFARSAPKQLEKLRVVTEQLALAFAPLGAVVGGRMLVAAPLTGALATAVALTAVFAGARAIPSARRVAPWLTVAAGLAAAGAFAASAPRVALLLLGALPPLVAWRARPGALSWTQLGLAFGAAAIHVAIALGSAAPLGVAVAAASLAAATTSSTRTLDLVAVAAACAAPSVAALEPVALLLAAALGAATSAVVGLRRDSLRLFAPALVLSLGAYVLSPAPVAELAAAVRDAFAAGIGYTREPLPLAWYGLTCLPYVLGLGWAVSALRRAERRRHAELALRWLGITALGLCALSIGGPDLRAPAFVLVGEGLALVAIGRWLGSPALTAAGPLALLAGIGFGAAHLGLGYTQGLLLAQTGVLPLVWIGGPLRRVSWWAAGLPVVLAAAVGLVPDGLPVGPWDVLPVGAAAALCVARGLHTRSPYASGLAVALAWRALLPLVTGLADPWRFPLAAGVALLGLLALRRLAGRGGFELTAALLGVCGLGALSGLGPLHPAHLVGAALLPALLLGCARWLHQRWAAGLAALSFSGVAWAALSLLGVDGPVALPRALVLGALGAGVLATLARRPRDRRFVRGPSRAVGEWMALLGLAGIWVAPTAAWLVPPASALLTLGLLVLAARLLPGRLLALAVLSTPALALLLLATRLQLDPAHAWLLVSLAPLFVWAVGPTTALPASAPFVPVALLVHAVVLTGWAGVGAVEASLSASGAHSGWAVTLGMAALSARLSARCWPRLGTLALGGALAVGLSGPVLLGLGRLHPAWLPALWGLLGLGVVGWAARDRALSRGAARLVAGILGLLAALPLGLFTWAVQVSEPSLAALPGPYGALPLASALLPAVVYVAAPVPHRAAWVSLAALPLVHALPLAQWGLAGAGRFLRPDVELGLLAALAFGRAPRVAVALAAGAALATTGDVAHATTPLTFTALVLLPLRRGRAGAEVALYLGVLAAFAWLAFGVPRTGTSPWEILPVFALVAAATPWLVPPRLRALLAERGPRVERLLGAFALAAVGVNLAARGAHEAGSSVALCAAVATGLVIALGARRRSVDVALAAGALLHAFLATRTTWLAPIDGYHTLLWSAVGLGCVLRGHAARVRAYGLALPLAAVLANVPEHAGSALASLAAALVYGVAGRLRGTSLHTWLSLAFLNVAAVRMLLAAGVADPSFYGVPLGLSLVAATRLERAHLGEARAGVLQLVGLTLAYGTLAVQVLRVEAPAHALVLFVAGLVTVAAGARTRRGDLLVAGVAVVVLDVVLHLVKSGFARDFGAAGLLVAAGAVVLAAAALHARRVRAGER